MAKRPTLPVMVAAVLEKSREGMREMLIVRLGPDEFHPDRWAFPFGPAEPGEMPEPAVRRILEEQLDIRPHIQHGQPPFDHVYAGEMRRWRFLFGELSDPRLKTSHYSEVRWVPRPSLREYEFEPVSQQVVDWMLEQ